jgi:UDP-N-acetyl-alpha-D-muramoyl-L-alanyl-L-glutamate epimerase
MSVLRLVDVHRGAECLVAACTLDDLRFHVTVWYEDLDLHELAHRHGDDLVERLAVHVALFQLNAACSLRPRAIELGRYARHLTPALVRVWRTVFHNVWAQWRYEHDLPDYAGPEFVDPPQPAPPPARVPDGPVELLAFCGGGKDSLVALKLLERAQLPFATLGYAHSIYGAAEPQHALLDRVASASARVRAERQWIIDDLLDAPIARLRPSLGVRYILAAETPASLFATLPLALARGYRGLVLAHERSAGTPNLIWNGEPVNHQWGKSFEAERLLDSYVTSSLLANVRYFSLLAPIHDELIFRLLARDAPLAPRTHSCNIAKPWCGRCPKCVYVWLQMAAHLPPDIVTATFAPHSPLGELPENLPHLHALLGIAGAHTPFECVGSIPEARLALLLARARGWTGPQLTALAAAVGPLDEAALAAPLLAVYASDHAMPAHVAAKILPLMGTV